MNNEEGMTNEQTAVMLGCAKTLVEGSLEEIKEQGTTERLEALLRLLQENISDLNRIVGALAND